MNKKFIPIFGTIFVVVPVTLAYGFIAFLGALSTVEIVQVWTGLHSSLTEVEPFRYSTAIEGSLGLLGISGLWLGTLYYRRFSEQASRFSRVTSILLLCGVLGAIYQNLGMRFDPYYNTLLLVAIYALFLIIRFMAPNKVESE